MHMVSSWIASIPILLFAAGAVAGAASISGVAPTYSDRMLSTPANAAAISSRMWVPGIDRGDVLQGLAVTEDAVILATYNSEGQSPKCRLYRIDPDRLAVLGHFDMPANCSHAGGAAYLAGGRLFVSDTWRLYEIAYPRAFNGAADAVVRSASLRFPLKGSFLAARGDALWLGEYKKPKPGTVWEIPLAAFEAAQEPAGLTLDAARRSMPVAPMTQGAAFDREGRLWLSQSNSQIGGLQQVDPETGAVLASFRAMAGLEDIGFDAKGRLWASSEAGTRRWHNWPSFYPLLFAIDPGALQ